MSALSSTVSQQLGPVKAIPVTGVSSGMAGGADLILTKAWRPPSKRGLYIALVIQIPAVTALR